MKTKSSKEYNSLTLQELDSIEDDSKIFKLVGMALIPQALEESRSNVNSRIEFLKQGM